MALTTLDLKFLPKVFALVQKYGKTVTFIVNTIVDSDPVLGDVTTSSNKRYQLKVSPPESYEVTVETSDSNLVGAFSCILPAQGLLFKPVIGMTLLLENNNSETWYIVKVGRLYSGEAIAAYEIVFNRG